MLHKNNDLIAEHTQINETNHSNNISSSTVSASSGTLTTEHVASTEHHGKEEFSFNHLLGELGDNYALVIGPYEVAPLPIILVDNGFHFYTSQEKMEEAGLYTMHHGKPARKSDMGNPALDMSITNLIFFQWVGMFIVFLVFLGVGRKYKKNPFIAPSGMQNIIERAIEFIRNDIVYASIANKNIGDKLLPYFLGLFFFIIVLNLLGLIPGGHTATGSLSVTGGLAVTAFLAINLSAIRFAGIGSWFKHLLGGAPVYLAPLMVPIEILSMFIKPFALTIRLFANMTAGHVILLSLLGMMFMFKTILISPAIIGFSIFIYLLELLVAYLQAYIFTMLVATFVGMGIGDHGHDGHEEAAHAH
ncbi:MAG: F0F1 ATP synthase subunit A [Candidatus Kapabacteria bacterium]|nr:F0F1 ATP synthase subunit A [Candidatus Kapabacteria bacterium]